MGVTKTMKLKHIIMVQTINIAEMIARVYTEYGHFLTLYNTFITEELTDVARKFRSGNAVCRSL